MAEVHNLKEVSESIVVLVDRVIYVVYVLAAVAADHMPALVDGDDDDDFVVVDHKIAWEVDRSSVEADHMIASVVRRTV